MSHPIHRRYLFNGLRARFTRLCRAHTLWSRNRIARTQIRSLLHRRDDHLLRDMGETRDALRRRFDLWDED